MNRETYPLVPVAVPYTLQVSTQSFLYIENDSYF